MPWDLHHGRSRRSNPDPSSVQTVESLCESAQFFVVLALIPNEWRRSCIAVPRTVNGNKKRILAVFGRGPRAITRSALSDAGSLTAAQRCRTHSRPAAPQPNARRRPAAAPSSAATHCPTTRAAAVYAHLTMLRRLGSAGRLAPLRLTLRRGSGPCRHHSPEAMRVPSGVNTQDGTLFLWPH